MAKSYEIFSASPQKPSHPVKQDTLLVSERLTSFEIERLRQDKRDASVLMSKMFCEMKRK